MRKNAPFCGRSNILIVGITFGLLVNVIAHFFARAVRNPLIVLGVVTFWGMLRRLYLDYKLDPIDWANRPSKRGCRNHNLPCCVGWAVFSLSTRLETRTYLARVHNERLPVCERDVVSVEDKDRAARAISADMHKLLDRSRVETAQDHCSLL